MVNFTERIVNAGADPRNAEMQKLRQNDDKKATWLQ